MVLSLLGNIIGKTTIAFGDFAGYIRWGIPPAFLVPTLCVGTHRIATLLRRGMDRPLIRGAKPSDSVRDAGASRSSAFPRRAWERGRENEVCPTYRQSINLL